MAESAASEDCEEWQPISTKTLRELKLEEKEKLDKDIRLVTEFKQQKLEKEAQKNWDLFYKRNTTKFFKDRHWTKREFSDLEQRKDGKRLVVFEVGCGVGNFMFPLLEEEANMFFYACDFSKRAVDFVKENPKYDVDRCLAFHCDITQDNLIDHIEKCTVDMATMIFVLSAIHPDKMLTALQKIYEVIQPGGYLLFRDYGLYDHAMLRFAPGHKLSEHFYVRQDGTRAYYFTIEKLTELVHKAGFTVTNCEYIHRQTVNKKEGLSVPRIFVQGKFQRPFEHVASDTTDREDETNQVHSDTTDREDETIQVHSDTTDREDETNQVHSDKCSDVEKQANQGQSDKCSDVEKLVNQGQSDDISADTCIYMYIKQSKAEQSNSDPDNNILCKDGTKKDFENVITASTETTGNDCS